MYVKCLFMEPNLTTHNSNIGVQIRSIIELGTSALCDKHVQLKSKITSKVPHVTFVLVGESTQCHVSSRNK